MSSPSSPPSLAAGRVDAVSIGTVLRAILRWFGSPAERSMVSAPTVSPARAKPRRPRPRARKEAPAEDQDKPAPAAVCTHHWLIDRAGKGTCRHCAAIEKFPPQRIKQTYFPFSRRHGYTGGDGKSRRSVRHMIGEATELYMQSDAGGRRRVLPDEVFKLRGLIRRSGLTDVQLARRSHIPVARVRQLLMGSKHNKRDMATLIEYLEDSTRKK